MGLFSFMCENSPTQGSIVTTTEQKHRAARESLAFNCKNTTFCELFPEFVEQYAERCDREEKARAEAALHPASTTNSSNLENNTNASDLKGNDIASWTQLAGLVGVLGVLLYAVMQLATL